MNNLKRVLSLALASVMLIGMMAVGASAADFTDEADIENKEAVGTMVALNIINGYPDGSYKPDELLLREQAAKMVFVALNGGKTSENLTTKATPTFSDIKGNWAEGYIEWAYNRGILAGMGDGTFNPKGNLTGTQLAKVMLVAIGYNAKTEGLEGTNDWALNVNSLALSKGFFEGLDDLDPEAFITRDQAAQLILNACKADMVEYNYQLSTDPVTGAITSVATVQDIKDGAGAKTQILKEKYNLDSTTHKDEILVNVTKVLTGSQKGTYQITVAASNDTAANAGTTFTKLTEDYSSLLGQKVTVLYKTGETDNVFGVYASDDNDTVTINQSALTTAAAANKAYPADAAGMATIVDGVWTKQAAAAATAGGLVDTDSFNKLTFIDNTGDGKYDVVVETTYEVAKVTYVSSTEVIAGEGTYSKTDDVVPEGIAKGDYVAVHTDFIEDNSVLEILTKETGKPVVNAANTKYQFDGTWYNKGADTLTAGKEYTYYTFNGVVAAASEVTTTASAEDLVMVVNRNTGLTDQNVILYADGTKKTVNQVAKSYSASDVDTTVAGTFYTVAEVDGSYAFYAVADGDKVGSYTFHAKATTDLLKSDKAVTGTSAAAGDEITYIGTASGTLGTNCWSIADDAVVFVYSGDLNDAIILTGKELKSIAPTDAKNGLKDDSLGFFVSKVNNLTRASIVAVEMAGTSDKFVTSNLTGDNFGLIVANADTVNSTTVRYTVWTGSENVVVTEKGTASDLIGVRKQFDVINYEAVEDGVITGVKVFTGSDVVKSSSYAANKLVVGPAISVSGGKLWYANDNSVTLNSDTVYMYMDSSTTTAANIGKTEGTLSQADTSVSGVAIPNVKFVADAAGDVTFVLVDVKNQLADAKTNALYGLTAPAKQSNVGGTGVAEVEFSKTSAIHPGETITMTVTVKAGKAIGAGAIRLTSADSKAVGLVSGTDLITIPATTATSEDVELEYSVVVGGGNISSIKYFANGTYLGAAEYPATAVNGLTIKSVAVTGKTADDALTTGDYSLVITFDKNGTGANTVAKSKVTVTGLTKDSADTKPTSSNLGTDDSGKTQFVYTIPAGDYSGNDGTLTFKFATTTNTTAAEFVVPVITIENG